MTYLFENTIVEFLKVEHTPGAFSKYAFTIKPSNQSFGNEHVQLYRIPEESKWETIEVFSIPGKETEKDLARRAYEFWKQRVQ